MVLGSDPALSEDAPLWVGGGGGDSGGDQNRRETLNTGPCVMDAQRGIHLQVGSRLGVRSGALPLSTKSRWWFAAGWGGVAGGGAHAHVLKLARTGGESDVSAPLQGSPALIYCMSPEQV